jgi:hypothetical protein
MKKVGKEAQLAQRVVGLLQTLNQPLRQLW